MFKELNDAWNAWNGQLMVPLWRREDGRTKGDLPSRSRRAARERVQDLAEKFGQADQDGDGKLSRDEYPRPADFDAGDADQDGHATMDEVGARFRARRGQGEKSPAP